MGHTKTALIVKALYKANGEKMSTKELGEKCGIATNKIHAYMKKIYTAIKEKKDGKVYFSLPKYSRERTKQFLLIRFKRGEIEDDS